ncbi:MAG: membrane protein insertion efficiency factor YidD [Muribaculaceae bacterium]|nr:membrane protein insertion efficiency factor YidD [Muribaculaceae bacterium]
MKRILIALIRFYQRYLSQYTPKCLYIPSCSEYCILAIQKYGLIKGLKKTRERLNRCDMEHVHLYGTEDWP